MDNNFWILQSPNFFSIELKLNLIKIRVINLYMQVLINLNIESVSIINFYLKELFYLIFFLLFIVIQF
jgi:hypothetical protein